MDEKTTLFTRHWTGTTARRTGHTHTSLFYILTVMFLSAFMAVSATPAQAEKPTTFDPPDVKSVSLLETEQTDIIIIRVEGDGTVTLYRPDGDKETKYEGHTPEGPNGKNPVKKLRA